MERHKLNINSYGASDKGNVRPSNEDAWGQIDDPKFFVLADGMGGHLAGEIAAKQTVDFLLKSVQELFAERGKHWQLGELTSMMTLLIENANTYVHDLSKRHRHLKGMGTTLCTLLFHEESLILSHVGDSRIYRLRRGELEQLTADHSRLESSKKAREVLTRAIGPSKGVRPDVQVLSLEMGDRFLMCSDGLTTHLSFDLIHHFLSQKFPLQEIAKNLINCAKEMGGNDNITVVITDIYHEDPLSLLRSQRHNAPLSKSASGN